MGKVRWGGGITGASLDRTERDGFEPYTGPAVPNGVYCWKIKVLRKGKSSGGYAQLIVGLELTPRQSRPEEKKYKGYFLTDYIVVTEGSQFRVVRFTDAIGVTGADFAERTITAGEPNARGSVEIAKIGRWVHNKKQYVMASIVDDMDQNGSSRKVIGGYWPIPEDSSASAEDEDYEEDEEEERPAKRAAKGKPKGRVEPEPDEDEEDAEDDDDSDDDEEETPPSRKAAKKAVKKAAPKRRTRDEDAEDDEGDDDEPPF